MIAEATTSREQQQQQQRRRSAARQQTNAALRDALAQRDGLPTEGPPLGCAERQRSAAQQQTIEAFWNRVEERRARRWTRCGARRVSRFLSPSQSHQQRPTHRAGGSSPM